MRKKNSLNVHLAQRSTVEATFWRQIMRRDRVLQSAVAAALALVPPLAGASLPSYLGPQVAPDTSLSLNGDGSLIQPFASPRTSGTWVGPFFTVNNGTTGRQLIDAFFSGGVVTKTGVGSIMLMRQSTNSEFYLKQGTVVLTDKAAVNGTGSAIMYARDDSVFGSGTLHIDGGTIRNVSQGTGTNLVNFVYNHTIKVGPNGANFQPGNDSPIFN